MEIEKSNIKWYIVFIILLVISAFVISIVRADDTKDNSKGQVTITYTPSSETTCDANGRCTLTQYSGIMYVQEDNTWKNLESARSLKGKGFEVKYLEDDKNYIIDVLDFNATSVELSLSKDTLLTKTEDIPLRVWSENNTKEIISGDFKQDYSKIEDTSISLSPLKQSDNLVISAKLGDIIEYGPNSTTIVLQTTGTENLADSYVAENSPSTNYGTAVRFETSNASGGTHDGIVSFNTSILPGNALIEKANLSLYLAINGLDLDTEGWNITTYLVYNTYSWTETTIDWDNRPLFGTDIYPLKGGHFYTFGGTGEPINVWAEFDTSNISNFSYTNGEKNMTFLVTSYQTMGGPTSADAVEFTSREGATASQRPKLTITYSLYTPPTGASCTYPGSGSWNINTHDNCTISSNVNLGGNNLILNGSGTIQMNANITNKGQLVMSSGSRFVLANGVRLG